MKSPLTLSGQNIGVPVQVGIPVYFRHGSCNQFRNIRKFAFCYDMLQAVSDLILGVHLVFREDLLCILSEQIMDVVLVLQASQVYIWNE